MDKGKLKRVTFVVPNAKKAAKFYEDVFNWTIWYDNQVSVDGPFPPAAPPGAMANMVILQATDPNIGMLGFLEYYDPPLASRLDTQKTTVEMGDPCLIIEMANVHECYEIAVKTDASIISPPVDWEVPGKDGGDKIKITTMSLFDPNGIYLGVTSKRE